MKLFLRAMLPASSNTGSPSSDFEVDKRRSQDSDRSSGDSDSEDSDSDDDDDESEEEEKEEKADVEEEEEEVSLLKKDMSTEELLRLAKERAKQSPKKEVSIVICSRLSLEVPTYTVHMILLQVKVCGCCLGHFSSDANEIVECDGCGISVHEGCYGVPSESLANNKDDDDDDGTASEVSAASTEPWFCEPCRSGVDPSAPPPCELCPLRGGIYKQTDVGRWVHLVCALYSHGVAFGDPERLTHVTVFEMNYSQWGRRACSLCQVRAECAPPGMEVDPNY